MNITPIKTEKKIQTSDWKTFGKSIANFGAAVKEFVDNSVQGLLKAEAKGLFNFNQIAINCDKEYLEVYDTGCGLTSDELIDSMGYGVQLADNVSMISFAGTGSITATAYINKENDDWMICSKKDGEQSCIQSPWEQNPHIGEITDAWPYSYFNTIRRTKISKGIDPVIPIEDIAQTYGFFLSEKNATIFANGQKIEPIIPRGRILCDTRNTPTIIGEGDSRVELSFIQYDVSDESMECGPYTRSEDAQGLYLFFNYRLVSHIGLKMLSDYTNHKMRKSHPSLNGTMTAVFINTFSNEDDCLLINSHKSEIDFSSCIGKKVAAAICDEISPFYREKYSRGIEADNRFSCEYDWNVLTTDVSIGNNLYLKEVYVCEKGIAGFTSLKDIPRIDGLWLKITEDNYIKVKKFVNGIIRKKKKVNPSYTLDFQDLQRYTLSKEDMGAPMQLFEFKNMENDITDTHVQQAIGYADYLRSIYKMNKSNIFITLMGGKISNAALIQLNLKIKDGYKIKNVPYCDISRNN